MTDTDDRPPQKLTHGVKAVLWLSAAALVAVAWVFWVHGQNAYSYPGEDPQRHVALAFSLVLLNACLVWLTRSGGSMQLRGLLAGILSGLGGMICLLTALAALNSWATGRPPDSVGSDVLTYAPLVGVLGGLFGLLYGAAAAGTASPRPPATAPGPPDEQATNAVDQDF
jgi:hypothetical protein